VDPVATGASALQRIFREALSLNADAREAYIASACAGDDHLLRAVNALLAVEFTQPSGDGSPEDGISDIQAGEQIGPYLLVRLLGSGGMGRVYLAERRDVQKSVALKVLDGVARGPQTRQRFLLERNVLARLDHANIARFLDAGIRGDGVPYFVMEYVDGTPLDVYASTLAIEDRVRLFENVCAAVAYAHQQLVVHRDLKPSNILVDKSGAVKLLDFGIAKLLEHDDDSLTLHGARPMTPAYAAPEQIKGGLITPATDVYMLGMLLFELLTGKRPYSVRELTPSQAERLICEANVPRPSTLFSRDRLPRRTADDLDAICLRAVEKDPARRYPTAADLRSDVQRYLSQRPVDARVPTRLYVARKFIARHRLSVALATVAALVVLAGSVAIGWQARRANQERRRAEQALGESQSVTNFLIGLFEAQHPTSAMGEEPLARTLIDRGLQRAELLSGQPLVQARMLDTIGRVYHGSGDLDRAEPPLRRALEIRRAQLGPRHRDTASSAQHLAALLYDKGAYEEAARQYESALEVQRSLGANDADLVQTLQGSGMLVLRVRRDDRLAEARLQEALRIAERAFGDDDPRVASALNTLAAISDYRADFAASEPLLRRALEIQTKRLGRSHPDTLETLSNLGTTLRDKGDLAGAEAALREALDLKLRVLGPKHLEVIGSMVNLASVMQRSGRSADAEALAREALTTAETTYGPTHVMVGHVSRHFAGFLAARGAYRDAETMYLRAIDIYRGKFGDSHQLVVDTGRSLSDMYAAWERSAVPRK
jgi:serine/threonine-protein kinase